MRAFSQGEHDDGLHTVGVASGYGGAEPAYFAYLRQHGYAADNPWATWANAVQDENGILRNGMFLKHAHLPARVDNGAAAVAAVSRQEFDLVLMDVRMKNVDGLAATRQIRAMKNPVKSAVEIFALTGDVTEASIASCVQAGMDGVLPKPLRLTDLYKCLSGQWQQRDVSQLQAPKRIDKALRQELSEHLPADQVAELFRLQLASLEKCMQELEASWQQQDAKEVVFSAHQIAGAAAMAGFGTLSAAASRLDVVDGLVLVDAQSDLESLRREWTATRYLVQQTQEGNHE